MFETETYRIPHFAIVALLYDYYSGIQDDDEAFVDNLQAWLDEEHGAGQWHIGDVSEPYHGRADFERILGEICNVSIEVRILTTCRRSPPQPR